MEVKSQTEQVIKNVECVLKEAGCTLADIVQVNSIFVRYILF